MPDGRPWPRVSIVTPSYNQAQFIEETIRSVLLQGYPDLEYIIIDGGSTDSSVEIIKKYEPWLSYWVSEPDRGQSHAINKGFATAQGKYLAWINSDDTYLPNVLPERIIVLESNPDAVLVYGDCNIVDDVGELIQIYKTKRCTAPMLLLDGNMIPQPSVFMRPSALSTIGWLNTGLHYGMDYELWLRLSLVGNLYYLPGLVANFRHHASSKTALNGYEFAAEKIFWLSKWPAMKRILTDEQRAEVLRRLHVRAALEAFFEGEEAKAVYHLSTSLHDGIWPYGHIDLLAEKIISTRGVNGHSIKNSSSAYRDLRKLFQRVTPKTRRRRLLHRISFLYHRFQFFRCYEQHDVYGTVMHLIKGIWYSPGWLASRGALRKIKQLCFIVSRSKANC